MELFGSVIAVLAVWRITHLLQAEDGPWDVVVRLRARAGDGGGGRLLDCFDCLSLWVAAPFALTVGSGWIERALLWPALSAGAMLLQRLAGAREESLPGLYYEDPEESDGMLRGAEATGASEDVVLPRLQG